MSTLTVRLNCLYRCTVVLALLWSPAAWQAALGQEQIPSPRPTIDPHASDPFSDEASPGDVSAAIIHALPMVTAGTLDRMHAPLLRRDLRITGAQSCAVSNCHGGPRPGVAQPWARRGSEYQLWKENDPHARSWRTICSDESVQMMRRLKIMDGNQIVDQQGFDNCLACHNTTMRFDEPRTMVDRREGVGCEACHGPAGQWGSEHFQYHWSPHLANQQGFVNAGDLYSRARMCASCHVGDKDRDMNHDIIAAGHPTLRYELATFHAWQPKHWRDPEAADNGFYEAQLWLAGQVAATDASLALLETRAANAHSVSEWPEFAAYNCASCHHNLGLDNDRDPIDPTRQATAMYSQWNDAGLRWLIDYRQQSGQGSEEDSQLIAALDEVKRAMETRPQPDQSDVMVASGHARRMLATWMDGGAGGLEKSLFRSDRLAAVVASAAGKPSTFGSWESTVQFYLAAVAARESWPGGWNGPLRDVADRLRYGLRYPEMIDISRFAKRETGSGPTASRHQATLLGVELAGWLGPVTWQPEAIQADDDPAEVDRRLQELFNEINGRWQQRRQQLQAEADANVQPQAPPRRPKTADELLEQRRQDGNTNGDADTDEAP